MSTRHFRPQGLRPQRIRFFIGCEGESEQGYSALLQRLADDYGLSVHLDRIVLGGGDPCAIVEEGVRQIRQRERRRSAYAKRFILLDADKLGQSVERDNRGRQLALSEGLHLVWQEPCVEALLLRHLPSCTQLRPTLTSLAEKELVKRWPSYKKPMPASRLAERIDLGALRRVQLVESQLATLLAAIGLSTGD